MGFLPSIQMLSPHLLRLKKIRIKTPNQATQWREKERTSQKCHKRHIGRYISKVPRTCLTINTFQKLDIFNKLEY